MFTFFLGFKLDTLEMLSRILQDKLDTYVDSINNLSVAKSATLQEFQSVIGKLQWSTGVIQTG